MGSSVGKFGRESLIPFLQSLDRVQQIPPDSRRLAGLGPLGGVEFSMITIIPVGGLANRMRAMDSADHLGKHLNRKVHTVWVKDNAMKIGFSELFKPLPALRIESVRRLPLSFSNSRWFNLHLPRLLRKQKGLTYYSRARMRTLQHDKSALEDLVRRDTHSIIVAGYRFFGNPDNYRNFHPIDSLHRRIDEETCDFKPDTFGVHIRRTDNKKAIELSPVQLFEEAIDEELDSGASTFYLASDSADLKEDFKQKYGHKMISNDLSPSRKSKFDIQQGLVELYALSRTTKVFGSYWSSFSNAACHITGIEEIIVKKSGF
jgi:hypothetical protein